MNLHGMVTGIIGIINPNVSITIARSAGWKPGADGAQVPQYTFTYGVPAQIQPMATDDLRQIEGLNIQGNKMAVYFTGDWGTIIRVGQFGGDLLLFPDQTWWLATINVENWPDWSKIIAVQQVNPPLGTPPLPPLDVWPS